MKVLIVCDTDEGLATELGLFLKCEAEKMNRRVVVFNAQDTLRSPDRFDTVIIAAEMKSTDVGAGVRQFVERHLQQLNTIPWFFLPILQCDDENNLRISETEMASFRRWLSETGWQPQQVLFLPAGVRLQDHRFVTLADWAEVKMALQRFLIRNDVMMAG